VFSDTEVASDDASNVRVNNSSLLAMGKYENCIGDVVRNPRERDQFITTCWNPSVEPIDKFPRHGLKLSYAPGQA
jgi:hypothetical protein